MSVIVLPLRAEKTAASRMAVGLALGRGVVSAGEPLLQGDKILQHLDLFDDI
jgi:hypothetical protein